MSTTMSEMEKKQQRQQLREFLRQKGIGTDMQQHVIGQVENWWAKKSVFDEAKLLEKLPPKHRKILLMKMYKPSLANSPLLGDVEEGVLIKLCLLMRPYIALTGDVVFREGEIGEEIFILIHGTIKLESKKYSAYCKRNWTDGAFFGELPVLGLGSGIQRNRQVLVCHSFQRCICSISSD